MNMASRRITLSTVGIARGIRKLAERGSKFNLAWSLHAPTNAKRAQIMDINKSNPIEEVVDAVKEFYAQTKRKVTLEYILFQKFNDTEEDARNLVKIAKGFLALSILSSTIQWRGVLTSFNANSIPPVLENIDR